jgi:hypothetical protein
MLNNTLWDLVGILNRVPFKAKTAMSKNYQPVGMVAPSASDGIPALDGMPASTGILDYSMTARTFRIDWATYEKSNFLKKAELELMTAYIAGTDAAKKKFLDLHGSTFFHNAHQFLEQGLEERNTAVSAHDD